MNSLVVPIGLLALVLLAVVIGLLLKLSRRSREDEHSPIQTSLEALKADLIGKQMEGLGALRESLDSAHRLLNERLAEGTGAIDRRLELFGDIEKKLGELDKQTQTIERIGRNIHSLSELLRPPKLRGGVGEMMLQNVLAQMLPSALYKTQYAFVGGQRVDAVVSVGERLVPIDAKFPLEAFERLAADSTDSEAAKDFRRAVTRQIDDIHAKYLRPDEGTTEFALMYIPSEAVYYECVAGGHNELLGYALKKRVVPSSPGHLYAFLASLAAVHNETSLGADSARLSAAVTRLRESLDRIKKWYQRLEGSSRSIQQNLTRLREELVTVDQDIGALSQPSTAADDMRTDEPQLELRKPE